MFNLIQFHSISNRHQLDLQHHWSLSHPSYDVDLDLDLGLGFDISTLTRLDYTWNLARYLVSSAALRASVVVLASPNNILVPGM